MMFLTLDQRLGPNPALRPDRHVRNLHQHHLPGVRIHQGPTEHALPRHGRQSLHVCLVGCPQSSSGVVVRGSLVNVELHRHCHLGFLGRIGVLGDELEVG